MRKLLGRVYCPFTNCWLVSYSKPISDEIMQNIQKPVVTGSDLLYTILLIHEINNNLEFKLED